MFALFKSKKAGENHAALLFEAALEQSLLPEFYTEYGVPDTLDGHFEMLVLHLFMVMQAAQDQALSQDVFDTAFRYMEKDLREAGIGDMGVPKHMKRMMTGFNGRVHAYQAAAQSSDWDEALRRNLYGTIENADELGIQKMRDYIAANMKSLAAQDLKNGAISFTAPKGA